VVEPLRRGLYLWALRRTEEICSDEKEPL